MGPLDRSGQCCGRAAQGRAGEVLYTEKFLRMDYADCDRQETRDLFSQIRQNADWSGWGFAHLKLYYTQAVQGITGILGAAALTVSLFTRQVPTSAGKLTALNHPLFLVEPILPGTRWQSRYASAIACSATSFSCSRGTRKKTWIAECTARANWRSIMSAQ